MARAKVNLALHITGVREDGYHELSSLVAFASFGDMLDVSPAPELRLQVDGTFAADVPTGGADNLVLQVAATLRKQCNVTQGADIRLHKHLPVASGIGGGSADAAAAVRLLCTLWEISLSDAELAEMLLPLGADIPVCLASQAMLVEGIGEKLTPVGELPPLGLLLVNPRKALPTSDVFRLFDAYRGIPDGALPIPVTGLSDSASFLRFLAHTTNSLNDAACYLIEDIHKVMLSLQALENCLLARMSGSGATCFALFSDEDTAKNAELQMVREHPQWWAQSGALVG